MYARGGREKRLLTVNPVNPAPLMASQKLL